MGIRQWPSFSAPTHEIVDELHNINMDEDEPFRIFKTMISKNELVIRKLFCYHKLTPHLHIFSSLSSIYTHSFSSHQLVHFTLCSGAINSRPASPIISINFMKVLLFYSYTFYGVCSMEGLSQFMWQTIIIKIITPRISSFYLLHYSTIYNIYHHIIYHNILRYYNTHILTLCE